MLMVLAHAGQGIERSHDAGLRAGEFRAGQGIERW